jgi:hypothetical protein
LIITSALGGACVLNAKVFKGRVVLPREEARDGWHSRGYFPHFDGEGVTQHVSFHLFDSLPQSVLTRWREELRTRPQKKPTSNGESGFRIFSIAATAAAFSGITG